jgi:hypothetical protein
VTAARRELAIWAGYRREASLAIPQARPRQNTLARMCPVAKKGFFNSITGMFRSNKEPVLDHQLDPKRTKGLANSLILQPMSCDDETLNDELFGDKRREKGREPQLSKSISRLDNQPSQKIQQSNSSHSRPPEKKSRWSIFGD